MAGDKRSISAIGVPLKSDISGFTKGLKDAKKEADKFHGDMTRSFSLMGKGISESMDKATGKLKALGTTNLGMLTKGLAGLAVAAAASAAAIATIGFKRISDLGKDALELGTSAEALSRLRAVAKATGTDVETLGEFIKGLTASIHESIGKTTTASEALKALGTSAEELEKLTPDEQIKKLNEGFARLPSDAERAKVAMQLAGQNGVKMFRMLAMGSRDFKAAMDSAPVVTDDDVSEARRLQIALDRIGDSVGRIAEQFETKVVPVITWAAELLAEIASKFSLLSIKIPKLPSLSAPAASAPKSSGPAPVSPQAAKLQAAAAEQQAEASKKAAEAQAKVAQLQARHDKLAGRPGQGRMVPSTNGTHYVRADRKQAAEQTSVAQQLNAAKEQARRLADEARPQSRAMGDAMRMNQGLMKQVADLKQEYRATVETSGQDEIHRRVNGIKGISITDRKALIQQGYQAREANKTSGLRDELQESTKLPIEKLGEDLARISRMAALGPANGGLTKAQALRAAAQKTAESGIAGGQTQFAGALSANSIEGRSYLLSQTIGRPEDAIEVARQGVAATMQGNGYLSRLVAAMGRPDVQVSF
jgi:hypothetical protein